jgi:hypothetical protein
VDKAGLDPAVKKAKRAPQHQAPLSAALGPYTNFSVSSCDTSTNARGT